MYSHLLLICLCFAFTILAAVNALLAIGQAEDLRQFLFDGGNTARIAAADNIVNFFGKFKMNSFCQYAVLDHADGDAGIQITENVQIDINEVKNLNDVFFAHFDTACIHDHGNSATKIAEL